MSRDADTASYYDDFSAHYDHGRDRGYHALVDRLESELVLEHASGKRVLEVGCGTGLLLERIAPHAQRAVGVDLSTGMLAHARARGLDVVEASATALPFPDHSFDVVYSFKVLAHVPDLRRALAEVQRVLVPGGIAVLEFYNRHSLRYLSRKIAGARRIGASHTEADVPTRWMTPREVQDELPPRLRLVALRGVRVVTPAAFVHEVPGVREVVARLEAWSMRSVLARWGGFLVVVAQAE
jgi:ubiquinone/menaquinone biosynthesis C-methylase UbiE